MGTLVKLNFQGQTFLHSLKADQGIDDLLSYASKRFGKPKDSLVLFGDKDHRDEKDAIKTNGGLALCLGPPPVKLFLWDKRYIGQDSEVSEHEVEVAELAIKHQYCFTREETLATIRHSRDDPGFGSRNLDHTLSFCLSELCLNPSELKSKGRGRRDVVQFFLEHNHKSKQVLAKKTSLKIEGKDNEAILGNALNLIEQNKKRLFGLLDYNLHKTSLVFSALRQLLDEPSVLSHFGKKLSHNKLPEELYSALFAPVDPEISDLVEIIRGRRLIIPPPDTDPEKKQIIEKAIEATNDLFDQDEEKEIFEAVFECLSPLSSPLPCATPPYPLVTIFCIHRAQPDPAVVSHEFYMIEIFQDIRCTCTKVEDESILSLGRAPLHQNHLAVAIPSSPETQKKFFSFIRIFHPGWKKVDLTSLFFELTEDIQDLASSSLTKLGITLINEQNIQLWADVLRNVKTKYLYKKVKRFIGRKGETECIKLNIDPRVLVGLCLSGIYNDTTEKGALFLERDITSFRQKLGL